MIVQVFPVRHAALHDDQQNLIQLKPSGCACADNVRHVAAVAVGSGGDQERRQSGSRFMEIRAERMEMVLQFPECCHWWESERRAPLRSPFRLLCDEQLACGRSRMSDRSPIG